MALKLDAVKIVVVLATSFTPELKSDTNEYCHLVTEPVLPESDNAVLLDVVHTVVDPDTDPPTLVGEIMIESAAVLAEAHTPEVTTAL